MSTLRSLVEWFMLCTPVAVANDTPSAPDSSLRPDWGKLTSSTGQGAAEEAEGQPDGEIDVPMPGAPLPITYMQQFGSMYGTIACAQITEHIRTVSPRMAA